MKTLKHHIIRAGAGAGKTSALIQAVTDSVTHYFEEHQTFPSVVISTFTRKATRELKERLILKAMELKNPALIEYICYSPRLQISTLHGLFYHFIQRQADSIGFSPGLSIMGEKESQDLFISLLKEVLLEQKKGTKLLDHYSFKEISTIAKQYVLPDVPCAKNVPVRRQEIIALIKAKKNFLKGDALGDLSTSKVDMRQEKANKSSKKNQLISLEKELSLVDEFCSLGQEMEILGRELTIQSQQKKQELNRLSLNDLEIMVWNILNKTCSGQVLPFEQGAAPFVLPRHGGDTMWFLDEYQDTSLLQKKILDRLSQNSQTFIVGDPQQSIYYFRGADLSVFAKKEQELAQDPESQSLCLTKNYRSTPELVDFFNNVFSEKNYQKMEAVRENVPLNRPAVRLIMPQVGGEETEFAEVIKCIHELRNQGTLWEDIAVLARQNKPLRKLSQHPQRGGQSATSGDSRSTHKNINPNSLSKPSALKIPFHLHASGGFIHRREVGDALFLWRFLLNPHDDENLIGLLRTPYARLPDSIIAQCMCEKKSGETGNGPLSLWRFLQGASLGATQPYSAVEKETVSALKHVLEQSQQLGLVEGFQQALLALGFMDLSYYQDPTGVSSANLWKLVYALKKQESRDSLLAFSENLFQDNFVEGGDSAPSSQNALSAVESSGVSLMTIHSAKGLEFKHVILIKMCAGFRGGGVSSYLARDLSTGQFALKVRAEEEDKRIETVFHKKVKEKAREQELLEFDRLLYVAMTRAKDSLTLIGAGKPEKNSWPRRFPYLARLKPSN